jgi:hopanoid biosynthesis associated RND transporter like protein HpnN
MRLYAASDAGTNNPRPKVGLMRFLNRILKIWTSFVTSRPRLVLGVAFLLAGASVWLTTAKLGIITDQLELLGKNNPLVTLSYKLDPFESRTKKGFDVVIEAPAPSQAVSFVQELDRLVSRDTSHFKAIYYRVNPELMKKWQLLYLSEPEITELGKKLDEHASFLQKFATRPDLAGFLSSVNREMSSRMVGEIFTGFLDKSAQEGNSDPFDLSPLINTLEGLSNQLHGRAEFKSPWNSFFEGDSRDPDLEGYFWESDKRYLIAVVVPGVTRGEMVQTPDSLAQLRRYLKELRVAFPGVKAGVTGQEAMNNDEMTTVAEDMSVATWLSILGVFTLLVIFRRSFIRPLLQMISLLVGICWSFGCATLLVGHLNVISVVFAPVLVGLGMDPAIHWFSRFEEEERFGGEKREIINTVNQRSGPGIFLAGFGNAICFLPFILTGFRGLTELGLITSMGIFSCLLSDFSTLVALTVLVGTKQRKEKPSEALSGAKDLIRLNRGSARMILACAGILATLFAVAAHRVYFDLNPLRLQAPTAESVIWGKRLIADCKKSTVFACFLASSPKELLAKAKDFKGLRSVSEVRSVYSLLPGDQEKKLTMLHALQPKIPRLRPVRHENQSVNKMEIIDTLERIRFKLQEDQAQKWGASRPLLAQMVRVRHLALDIISTLRSSPGAEERLADLGNRFSDDLKSKWDFLESGTGVSAMGIGDLPDILKDSFYHGGTYLLRIYPKESIWDEHALAGFVEDLQRVDPEVVGDPVALYVFASVFKNACVKASVYTLISITILLVLAFKNIRLVVISLAPLMLGSLFTVGIMGLADIEFNLANSIFMPLVVGAGVEYAVVIVSRWAEGRMIPGHLPFSTGKGVILAALTTTMGFGVLMISRHLGIYSLGFVSLVGSLCVLLCSILIVPAILAVLAAEMSLNGQGPQLRVLGTTREG